MDKEVLLNKIQESNLSEDCKQEVIRIINQYDKKNIEELLIDVFKVIGLGADIIKFFLQG